MYKDGGVGGANLCQALEHKHTLFSPALLPHFSHFCIIRLCVVSLHIAAVEDIRPPWFPDPPLDRAIIPFSVRTLALTDFSLPDTLLWPWLALRAPADNTPQLPDLWRTLSLTYCPGFYKRTGPTHPLNPSLTQKGRATPSSVQLGHCVQGPLGQFHGSSHNDPDLRSLASYCVGTYTISHNTIASCPNVPLISPSSHSLLPMMNCSPLLL